MANCEICATLTVTPLSFKKIGSVLLKHKPRLIVVTGRPGAGKTTLAYRLAKRICCPMLSRDEIKEGFCVTNNADHSQLPADTNRQISEFYFHLLSTFVKQNISLVTEAAFQHKLWQPQLEALQAHCEVRIIRCVIHPETAQQRMRQRGLANARRERFHRDFKLEVGPQAGAQSPGDFTHSKKLLEVWIQKWIIGLSVSRNDLR